MSAFKAYAGAYEFAGTSYGWSCYATAAVHEMRQIGHTPLPSAPAGRKWIVQTRKAFELEVIFLVDATVEEFSQILLQVQAQAPPVARPAERRAGVASAAA